MCSRLEATFSLKLLCLDHMVENGHSTLNYLAGTATCRASVTNTRPKFPDTESNWPNLATGPPTVQSTINRQGCNPGQPGLPGTLSGRVGWEEKRRPTVSSVCLCVHVCAYACMRVRAHLCLTLWDPVDCNLPGSPVHGIFPARIPEWVAISSSRGLFLPGSPALAGGFFTTEPPGKPPSPQDWQVM